MTVFFPSIRRVEKSLACGVEAGTGAWAGDDAFSGGSDFSPLLPLGGAGVFAAFGDAVFVDAAPAAVGCAALSALGVSSVVFTAGGVKAPFTLGVGIAVRLLRD